MEYLQLGNFGKAGWKIVNILYTNTQGLNPTDGWEREDLAFWTPAIKNDMLCEIWPMRSIT